MKQGAKPALLSNGVLLAVTPLLCLSPMKVHVLDVVGSEISGLDRNTTKLRKEFGLNGVKHIE